MAEEAWCVRCRVVAMMEEVGNKTLVCKNASLRKAVHALADFHHDMVVVDEGRKVVLL